MSMVALHKLRIENLLSFGARGAEVELRPLNVLIGPNGSGKSNLIEVIGLLNSTLEDLAEPFRETGGIDEWIWKGKSRGSVAIIEATANVPRAGKPAAFTFPSTKRRAGNGRPSSAPLRYRLAFRATNHQLEIIDERVEAGSGVPASVFQPQPDIFFANENGRHMLNVKGKWQTLKREETNPQKSILSQRKDPEHYPELTSLGRLFASFRFYRDWEFGIDSRAREASPTDAPLDFLEESARNLALMISQLWNRPGTKAELLENLKIFYADAESLNTPPIAGGLVEIRLQEKGKFDVSAKRLSDGTLRWMALLTILLHPTPPPLVCLEEPELGLHPDVIRPLAKLLVKASERMQLIVTTHSDTLIDELTETPEAVLVCEKDAGSTTVNRLDQKDLSKWLEQYTLGELWHKGKIGGTRW